MKDNQAKYPQLRFKGFTDPWEERKFFESIASTIDFRGRTPKKLGMDWSDSGYLALSALNVKNGYIDPLADAHYGDEKLYRKWMSGRELKKGQVLFTTEAPMGNVAQVPDDNGYILSQRTVAFETKEDMMTNDFLAVLLKSPLVFNNLSALSSGGTAKGVSQKSLKGLSITVPLDIDEQQKIGSFFKQLDDTITLHQRKLAKLKELKQGYLQKLFPKNGSKFPQLRFAGFADAWEQRKLKQLVKSRDKDRIPIESGKRQAGKYPYYGATGIVDHVKDYIFEGTYLLLAEDGANILDRTHPISYVVNGRFWVNNHAHTFQSSQGTDLTFLAESLERIHYQRYNTGTAQPKLNAKVVGKIEVLCPTSNEQRKLGKLSYLIDVLIAANQRKLEKLQELKKGYLQKMFC
ncbi:restriction endonuclease subunit S [Lentilactobacillus diolivorans]|uniref:restriction endonuclease subunit S n=1 Tax=Lentilactobacillus diolivorans TaxID=179838 RepID=UPI002468C94F|nr:restriction endonuclease subunit S [Lentilactobacillus diolivorans]MDH5106984.1 restriction endonuclease subunit S [Lentilactobacillus diolivorans]